MTSGVISRILTLEACYDRVLLYYFSKFLQLGEKWSSDEPYKYTVNLSYDCHTITTDGAGYPKHNMPTFHVPPGLSDHKCGRRDCQ